MLKQIIFINSRSERTHSQMKLQRLLSLLRQAIDQYQMIENGDHIAIGISGGKDSLTLLYGLSQLQ